MLNFDQARAKNLHFRGGRSGVTAENIVDSDTHHPGSIPVDADIMVTALEVVNQSGKVQSSEEAHAKLRYRIWLAWKDAAWKVIDTKRVVVK